MSDEFCLLVPASNADKYSIKLDNIHITVDRYEVSPEINRGYFNSLKSSIKPQIPFSRNYIKVLYFVCVYIFSSFIHVFLDLY